MEKEVEKESRKTGEPATTLLFKKSRSKHETSDSPKTGDDPKSSSNRRKSKRTKSVRRSSKTPMAPKPKLDIDELELWDLPLECCDNLWNEQARRGAGAKDMLKNRMSVAWFEQINLNADQQKQICFGESLVMADEMGNSVGKMYASVSLAKWGDQPCLCTHSGSYGKLSEGLECGTTITGFVDFRMRVLQEYVYEWAVSGEKVIERKTYIMKEDPMMHVRTQLTKDGKAVETKAATLGQLEQHNLVTESVNIILLRWIMKEKRMFGGMELKTLTFQGKVVKNKYAELGNGWENIKGDNVRVWSIRRTVEFDFGDRLWDSMFNHHARLMLRCQPQNTHALIPLWFEPVKDLTTGVLIDLPPYIWACDAELHARYLLKKDETAGDNRSYLLDHPELRALLSDFLQALLLRKPTNIIAFSQQYFETFLKIHPQEASTEVSSESSESAYDLQGEGDWGEGGGEFDDVELPMDDSYKYYNVKPKLSDDGLVQITDDDSSIEPETPNPDENVAVSDGQYVVTE